LALRDERITIRHLDRLWKIANDDVPALITGLEAILGLGRA